MTEMVRCRGSMDRNSRFDGKVVIVTGGGSGIGKAIALRFAQERAVVAVADINQATVDETQRALAPYGSKSLALRVDVAHTADVRGMVDRVMKELGAIDILVNNAGIIVRAPLMDTSEEDWDRVIAVDLRGVYLCTKYVVPEIIRGGEGKIVNISSLTGLVGLTAPAYTAAKGGVISLTRILAGELAPYRINVNAVCPGFIATAISENFVDSEMGKVIRQKIPWNRFGKPEDVAAAVLFLASPEADYITGTILPIDGGLSSFLDFGEEYRTFDRKKPSL